MSLPPLRGVTLAALCALAAGCDKPAKPTAPGATAQPVAGTGAPGQGAANPAPQGSPTPGTPAAEAVAKLGEFTQALGAKAATPPMLSAAFKQLIAPAAASSDWNVKHYLDDLPAPAAGAAPVVAAPTPDVLLAAVPADKGQTLLVRMAQSAAGTWQADWAQAVRPGLAAGGGLTPVGFAAAAFVEATLARSPALAASLMTPAARTRLAPPRDDADKAASYSSGILTIALNRFRGNATAAAFDPPKPAAAGNATLSGKLTGGEPRPFTLTVTPAGLIEAFEAN